VSFHYDQQHALAALAKLDDDHPLCLMAGKIKGLTLFDFSEEIVSRPIFERAGHGDIQAGMEIVKAFIRDLVSSITTFHAQMTMMLFRAHGMQTERTQMKLRPRYEATPGKVFIPISVRVSQ
jgi:hypothetical protein